MVGARPVRTLAGLALALMCGAWAHAQAPTSVPRASPSPPPTTSTAATSLDEVEQLRRAGRTEEAAVLVDAAVQQANAAGDRASLARAYRLKGLIVKWERGGDEGRQWLQRALELFSAFGDRHGIGMTLSDLAAAHVETGDAAAAVPLAQDAARVLGEVGDSHGRAIALLCLGRARMDASGSAAALPAIEEALAIGDRTGDDLVRGFALKERGSIEFASGELASSQASLGQAIAALERTDDTVSLSAATLQLGRVFRAHGDYETALRHYRRAADLAAPTREVQVFVEATNATGVALAALGRHDEAIAAYERGLARARTSGSQRLVDFMLGNLGGGLIGAKQYERASEVLRDVLARQPEPYIAAFRNSQLATALASLGRFDEALGYASEGIRLTRELKLTEQLDDRLSTRGWILDNLGRLEDALVDHREALAVVERVRERLAAADLLRRGYGDMVQGRYSKAIDVISRLGRPEEALELSEQARARAFLDLIAASRETPSRTVRADQPSPRVTATGPPAVATVPVESRAGVLSTRGADGPGEPAGDMERPAAVEAAVSRPLSLASLKALAARLGSPVLSYWVADDVTLAWLIGRDGTVYSARVPAGRAPLAALVQATTAPLTAGRRTRGDEGVTDGSDDGAGIVTETPLRGVGLLGLANPDRSAWRKLHELLIDPFDAAMPTAGSRLTIVPHGPLFRLSFAALQDSRARYLVERYDIAYAPSATTLAAVEDRTVRRPPGAAWLLVGSPASMPAVGSRPLAPLPAATRELEAIAAIAHGHPVTTLSGPKASMADLEQQLAALHPEVLHVATHGIVFDDPKKVSFLALDSAADGGRFTADRVYGLHLTADLVVLSACRTGAGQVTGDGIVGLTRAFFAAGAASVVASFWDVADESTYLLMRRFYRGYGRTGQKSRSLREAQIALIADLRAGRATVAAGARRIVLPEHPLLWAGFFLSGDR